MIARAPEKDAGMSSSSLIVIKIVVNAPLEI